MTPLAFGLCAAAVVAVMQRERLARWVRRAMAAPAAPVPIPSTGPYREAGRSAARRDSTEPLFAPPPPSGMVYRRDRIVYAAIVVGGPLALVNVLIVPFFTDSGLQQLCAVTLGLAIPCATAIGARINRRLPTIPEGVALWSVLSHLALLWPALRSEDGLGSWGMLAAYALGHAILTVIAARAEPVAVQSGHTPAR